MTQKKQERRFLVMAFVSNSVGLGAKNFPQDVKIVQWLLVRAQLFYGIELFSRVYVLSESGIADSETTSAIRDIILIYPNKSLTKTINSNSIIYDISSNRPIVFPDDRTEKILIKCSLKPICLICTETGDIKLDFNSDPLAVQAISGRINFQTFKHLAENKDNSLCESLTKDGIEAKALLNNPRIRTFLDMIAVVEGTDKSFEDGVQTGYDVEGGSDKIHPALTDLSLHPGKAASGRYQAIPDTWTQDAKRLGLTDFTPESQDIFGAWKLKNRGMVDDILNNRFENAINIGSLEWASFPNKIATQINGNKPTSNYTYSRGPRAGQKQPAVSAMELKAFYEDALKIYKIKK